jgi:hypothetical protein
MGKYQAIYRCLLCGREMTPTEKPIEMNENDVPAVLGKAVANQQFLGNPYLYEAPLHLPHKCGNGDGGLAPLIGLRRVDKVTQDRPKSRVPRLKLTFGGKEYNGQIL